VFGALVEAVVDRGLEGLESAKGFLARSAAADW